MTKKKKTEDGRNREKCHVKCLDMYHMCRRRLKKITCTARTRTLHVLLAPTGTGTLQISLWEEEEKEERGI